MDFIAPNRFIDLSNLKVTNIDFEKEADQLQAVLITATKENDIQQYINPFWIPASLMAESTSSSP